MSMLVVDYTDLAMSMVTQRQSVAFTGTYPLLYFYLNQLSGEVRRLPSNPTVSDRQSLMIFSAITVTYEPRIVTLEVSHPVCLFQILLKDKLLLLVQFCYGYFKKRKKGFKPQKRKI